MGVGVGVEVERGSKGTRNTTVQLTAGLDSIQSDSRFDFLSFFTNEEDDDAVPDSFFTNNHCSPYSNINLICNYLEVEKLSNLDKEKFTVLSINIQSLPAKFSEFSDLIN